MGEKGGKNGIFWMEKRDLGGKEVKMRFLDRKKGFLVAEKGGKNGIFGRKKGIFGGGKEGKKVIFGG